MRPFLGKPEIHWRARYSAYEAAHSWFAADGLPPAIRAILDTDPRFAQAALEKATFEKQTHLDNLGRGPSQTDVLAVVRAGAGRAVLGIEAKVDEAFGPVVDDWNDYSAGKLRRLASLVEALKLRGIAIKSLRYQLLHRTAAAIIEAEREQVADVFMLVQSFSPDNVRAGFDAFQAFTAAMNAPVASPGELSQPIQLKKVVLRLGWTINEMASPGP